MDRYAQYFSQIVLSLLIFAMMIWGYKAYVYAIAYEDATTQLVQSQGLEAQTSRKLESFAKSILGELYEDKRQAKFSKQREAQSESMHEAKRFTRYFMYTLGGVLLFYFFVPLQIYTFFGSLAAFISLVLGLISPILMVTIHKEVEYLGDIVLSFESKGILGSILKLLENGDSVVAVVILLFSVIVPLFKIVTLLFISLFVDRAFALKLVKIFKAIGKWSMVDVFVVAVFLVYLTTNNADVSRAEIEVGLYFFLAYVIVSMLMSLSVEKMLKIQAHS